MANICTKLPEKLKPPEGRFGVLRGDQFGVRGGLNLWRGGGGGLRGRGV